MQFNMDYKIVIFVKDELKLKQILMLEMHLHEIFILCNGK